MTYGAAEEWARRIIEIESGRNVTHHDDGSQPSMYDLRIGDVDAPELAVEVVGAVDELWTQTWNTGPARQSLELDLSGNWMVSVIPGANFKMLRKALPQLLAELERRAVTSLPVNARLRVRDHQLFDRLESLGVDYVAQYQTDGSGKVTFHMMGPGGAIDSEGLAVPDWITSFVRDPARADVLMKLRTAPARRREIFVAVTLEGAPWGVTSYLTGISSSSPTLPPAPPSLPEPVDGVWIAATLSFGDPVGVRWDGETWRAFRTRGVGIDDDEATS